MVQFIQANIKRLYFPDDVREKFSDYISQTYGDKNPYRDDFEDLKYAVAYKMYELLAHSNDRENAAKILNYIEESMRGKQESALVIDNFPVDPQEALLQSPRDPDRYGDTPELIGKEGYIAEWALTAINMLTGNEPTQTQNIQNGERFHHLVPRLGKDNVQGNVGAKEFPWHTEAVYRSDNDFTMFLLGLKNKETPTLLATQEQVFDNFKANGFTQRDFEIMKSPRFRFLAGAALNKGEANYDGPMIEEVDGQIEMRLNGNLDKVKPIDADDLEAKAVIEKVAKSLATLNTGVILGHGTLVIFKNRNNIHSRTPISDYDMQEGQVRHLIRTQSKPTFAIREEMKEKIEPYFGR